jgi:hypothetical protein
MTAAPARFPGFLVVADHAENLGLASMFAESNPELLRTEFGKKIHGLVQGGDPWGAYGLWGDSMSRREDPLDDDALTRSIWEPITAFAEEFSQPGVFTAFIAFEWTSSPGGNNLHWNVSFRGDKDGAGRILPFSNDDSTDPEDVWKWMAEVEDGGPTPGRRPQREPLQRADIRRRHARQETARPGVCRAPDALGADLRGDPAEGALATRTRSAKRC